MQHFLTRCIIATSFELRLCTPCTASDDATRLSSIAGNAAGGRSRPAPACASAAQLLQQLWQRIRTYAVTAGGCATFSETAVQRLWPESNSSAGGSLSQGRCCRADLQRACPGLVRCQQLAFEACTRCICAMLIYAVCIGRCHRLLKCDLQRTCCGLALFSHAATAVICRTAHQLQDASFPLLRRHKRCVSDPTAVKCFRTTITSPAQHVCISPLQGGCKTLRSRTWYPRWRGTAARYFCVLLRATPAM